MALPFLVVWSEDIPCPECEVVHDRDHEATKNVLAAGLAVSACGEAVRSSRAQAQSGKPRQSRNVRM